MESVSMLLEELSPTTERQPDYTIFKAGDENDFGNYRLISALPCFSKILEKFLFNHLSEHTLLYQKQFYF